MKRCGNAVCWHQWANSINDDLRVCTSCGDAEVKIACQHDYMLVEQVLDWYNVMWVHKVCKKCSQRSAIAV